MKIAFVYDRVNKFGGAERVLLALHEIWPEAPLYTAVYNKKKSPWADCFKVQPSCLNRIPFISKNHEMLPLVTPYAFESFGFEEFDVVLTITSADAKGIITAPDTLHICYLLTPTRYLWSGYQNYMDNPGFGILNPVVKIFMKIFSPSLRLWDFVASHRPDFYITISKTVANRIKSYYKKDSILIYPPVDIDKFRPAGSHAELTNKDYFLIVSRLVPYKKIDNIILIFNKLGYKLKIIGSGIEEQRLKQLAADNIEFINSGLTDEKLCWYYQNCKGLIFPGEEDFGIAAVEAQACGKPVIGVNKGGIGEIVIPGVTGELYDDEKTESFIPALNKIIKRRYDSSVCRANAVRFAKQNFQKDIKKTVESHWKMWKQTR